LSWTLRVAFNLTWVLRHEDRWAFLPQPSRFALLSSFSKSSSQTIGREVKSGHLGRFLGTPSSTPPDFLFAQSLPLVIFPLCPFGSLFVGWRGLSAILDAPQSCPIAGRRRSAVLERVFFCFLPGLEVFSCFCLRFVTVAVVPYTLCPRTKV